MLTFEKVLEVFGDYLQQDPLYEVVTTSHGYTLMAWEPRRNDWYKARHMATPEILMDDERLGPLYGQYPQILPADFSDDRKIF